MRAGNGAGDDGDDDTARFYPELAPDRISLPAHGWATSHELEVVQELRCVDKSLSIALCSGAPCFDAPADGPLNVTCLCPIYPTALNGSVTLRLPAPAVGHLGGCASYEADGGPCAVQHTSAQLEGPAMREWSVAAVRSMSSAPRATNGAMCRDWFATTSDPF